MPEKEYKPTEEVEAKKQHLISLAKKCAKLLKEKYKVKRVFLIGSLTYGIVHNKSDIDLVVEGLPSERYIDALVDLNDILERKIELNLIPFEDAFETLREKTLREGMLIYE
jgi:predicted nucleotidyltransferase